MIPNICVQEAGKQPHVKAPLPLAWLRVLDWLQKSEKMDISFQRSPGSEDDGVLEKAMSMGVLAEHVRSK